MENTNKLTLDAKQVFRQCGTCSQTFGHILNHEFGHPNKDEEKALDPLAGGIVNEGQQCGMLWGTAMAIGAEAFRQHKDVDEAIAITITATQHIIDSFISQVGTLNCREITGYDLSSFLGLIKFGLKTTLTGMNNSQCFNMAEEWAPMAIKSAREGLANQSKQNKSTPISCASLVGKKMGASQKEQAIVSGFAGGLGLSGQGCGALSAAIYLKTLVWCKDNPEKTPPLFYNKSVKRIIKKFKEKTGSELVCKNITKQTFSSIDDHSQFIREGGCKSIIDVLINS